MGKKNKLEAVLPSKRHEVVVQKRHQSRRAASKEALKQMQILLEDENDTVEIPDDDDVIPVPVVVSPPRKKYKLSHRKSSDGNDREVLVLKSITPNITNHNVENNLELECWVEELEPCQKERNKKLEEEYKAIQEKLDELVKACKGEVVHKGDLTTVIEVSENVQKTIHAVQASNNKQPNIILNSSIANPQSGYQLVMDPRLGLVLGMGQQPAQTPPKQLGKVQVSPSVQPATPPTAQVTPTRTGRTRGKKQISVLQPTPPPPPVTVTTRSVGNAKQSNKGRPPAQPLPQPTPPATRSRGNVNFSTTVVSVKPTETNVEGGLSTGASAKSKAIVDLTADDGKHLPDSREISFNKLQGKTFPSLVVVARPHFRVTDVNSDRVKLDTKVKAVLMYQPAKFTEWLIQQGLIKSKQVCSTHGSQLKLGMYSDVSKFPYSGGYVWISECCPQKFVSVFSGSIFEGSPHPPLVILKILYHWACQTNIQNVTQWVKVDNLYVKGMYTWLRAACTVALHTYIRQLGGSQCKVEVGVISLGTTSQDGNSRQVKVEVLGILEVATKLVRLKAVEPLAEGDRNYKRRFSKILEPLVQWVHPSSVIVTDLTVDKATLVQMGFNHVVQSTSMDSNNSNRTIMEYLRRIVPRMFQNTLSLLSRQIIQQFLDELVWREWFGTTSMQAFDNLVVHLAEQTRQTQGGNSLFVRLNKVAMNPFRSWALTPAPVQPGTVAPPAQQQQPAPKPAPKAAPVVQPPAKAPEAVSVVKKRKRKEPESPKPPPPTNTEMNRPPKSTSPDVPEQMVPLENYYYGTIDNYPPRTNITLNMKCSFCKETFNNNIVLMNHLFKHAHNVSKDGQMCRYCLASVSTANDLLKHIATAHPVETKHDNGFVCLICETQYMNPFVLGKHMSKEHGPSELPYQCGTCGYRCSNHRQVIDHFYKQHDNGPTIQCPFCLKSTTVFSASRNIVQNMSYFIQHLQKHQKKQFAKRCGKCNLWFVQKEVLKDHQMKMHASQRGKTGLISWVAPRNGVMVPKSKMDIYPCDAEGINFNTLFFNLSKNLKCKECNSLMDSPKHFPSFESCQNPNCQYSTCCSNAMQEHNAKCSKTFQAHISEDPLPYEMFCICGYRSRDGNQMANHLAICERKSAYPSVTDAKSASVTHSMLDVLGLVRKPDETDKNTSFKSGRSTSKADSRNFEENQSPRPASKKIRRAKLLDHHETTTEKLKSVEKTESSSPVTVVLDDDVEPVAASSVVDLVESDEKATASSNDTEETKTIDLDDDVEMEDKSVTKESSTSEETEKVSEESAEKSLDQTEENSVTNTTETLENKDTDEPVALGESENNEAAIEKDEEHEKKSDHSLNENAIEKVSDSEDPGVSSSTEEIAQNVTDDKIDEENQISETKNDDTDAASVVDKPEAEILESKDDTDAVDNRDDSEKELLESRNDTEESKNDVDDSEIQMLESKDDTGTVENLNNSEKELLESRDDTDAVDDVDNLDNQMLESKNDTGVADNLDRSENEWLESKDDTEVTGNLDRSENELLESKDDTNVAGNLDNSDTELLGSKDDTEVDDNLDSQLVQSKDDEIENLISDSIDESKNNDADITTGEDYESKLDTAEELGEPSNQEMSEYDSAVREDVDKQLTDSQGSEIGSSAQENVITELDQVKDIPLPDVTEDEFSSEYEKGSEFTEASDAIDEKDDHVISEQETLVQEQPVVETSSSIEPSNSEAVEKMDESAPMEVDSSSNLGATEAVTPMDVDD
ncbi:uncharacterized protein LOC115879678 isoform X2 [Sitophilus oryzae]|uniref:Uncharacterized protein LOC115879678 isoform X2 n=1 Tax=Sitophilus oryzae TaxID=7048 RepID=A0A6J2XLQ9_SITOR|nr:uncharacterized protein LOC115879678 isoform X2 [Sitophilus oryzae]